MTIVLMMMIMMLTIMDADNYVNDANDDDDADDDDDNDVCSCTKMKKPHCSMAMASSPGEHQTLAFFLFNS